MAPRLHDSSADASTYLLESEWHTLRATGDLKQDLLHFYELEYKYSKITQAPSGNPADTYGNQFVIPMNPRRRESILNAMGEQARRLGASIA